MVEVKALQRRLGRSCKRIFVQSEVISVEFVSSAYIMLALLVLEEDGGGVLLSLVWMRGIAEEVVEVSAHSLHVGHLLVSVHARVAAEVLPRVGL